MAEVCCESLSGSEKSSPCDSSSRARRRRMEIRRVKYVASAVKETDVTTVHKRQKSNAYPSSSSSMLFSRDFQSTIENSAPEANRTPSVLTESVTDTVTEESPKFGMASVCGRRRDMEDAVALHPSFCRQNDDQNAAKLHYYGVYDGHGCSHVAMKCRDRLHELVKDEVENGETEWKSAMERSFKRMDAEVIACKETVVVDSDSDSGAGANCRCELQTPECDTVGSTAVVAVVTPDKIVVANCGDSRAVLCRNGGAVPLSSDHKPDRPDELNRIQSAGGRVIYWEGARVLGVLAMSRAIGDNYLKPYVSCEPEITITDRTDEDECLILASDGLWDLVSNDTACGVVRMCLRGRALSTPSSDPDSEANGVLSDKACADAAMLLTKLALARHSTDNVSVVVVDLKRYN